MRSPLQHTFTFTTFILAIILFGNHQAIAATPYQFVKVEDRQLLVDFDRTGNYTPFLIKGVAYSPTPIGRYSDDWGYPSPADSRPKNLYDDPAVLNRDFKLLKTMNANVVRFWKGNNTQVTLADTQNPQSPWYRRFGDITRFPNYLTTQTFDIAQTYGIKIIAGFEMPWPGSWQCDQGASAARYQFAVDFNDPYLRNDIISRFRTYVLAHKDHPALLFWAIGNENNLGFNDQTPQGKAQIRAYYSLIQTMAQEARLIEGSFYHPVAIVNGDLGSIGKVDLGSADSDLSNIDIWGANIYRGASFGTVFQDFAALSSKAFWLSEYGEDAWQTTDVTIPQTGQENQAIQATIDGGLWTEIKAAYLNQKSIGGTLMAYSDEWWKPYTWLCDIDNDPNTYANGAGGCNMTQNYYGFGPQDQTCPADGTIEWTPPAADHFFHEEWWGIMAISQDARPGYPDIMTPRQVYSTLQQLFYDDKLAPSISIQSPGNNTVAVGTSVSLLASATDNVGVVGVQFKLDGINLTPEDLDAPYSLVWDTTTTTDGTHTITAIARDSDGNTATASTTITVANNAPVTGPILSSAVAGDSQASLSWTNSFTAIGYTVRYGTTVGSYPYFIDLPNATTATIPGLFNGKTYYFVVQAKYNGGVSAYSNELNTTLLAPDFVVTDLSTSTSTTQLGTTISIQSTIKNIGSVAGATFITAYYLSFDDQITRSDILLGTRIIPDLAAGASSNATSIFTIPATIAPTSYYLGAIADYTSFRVEQNENNNTLLGEHINVTASADLMIPTLNGPVNALPGETVTLTAIIKNQGASSVGANLISYYLSVDPNITTDDNLLAIRYVSGLAAGASASDEATVTIPSTFPVGTYYWGAIVDFTQSQTEANENNNSKAGNTVNIITNADLIMTAINGPTLAAKGETINVTDTIKNQGTLAIGANLVGYYLSLDSTITPSDYRVGVRYVPGLAAGASNSGNTSITVPANLPAGTYYWGAIADYSQSQAETNENNNTLAGGTIIISSGADLIMTAVNGPATATVGQTVNVTDTVKNQGSASIGPNLIGYYLSPDSNISTSDIRAGVRYVSDLAPGATNNGNTSIAVPANLPAGTYYWGAIADYSQSQAETNENNNTLAGGTIIISSGADLIMTAVNGPATATIGQTVNVTDTVKNQGSASIGPNLIGYYLSTDSNMTTSDIRVGVRYVPDLAPGATNNGNTNITIPATLPAGTYYWGVIADYTQSRVEANETNNALTGGIITITPTVIMTTTVINKSLSTKRSPLRLSTRL